MNTTAPSINNYNDEAAEDVHNPTIQYGFYSWIFIAILSPTLSLFAGLGLAPSLIIVSLAPLFYSIKNQSWKQWFTNPDQQALLLLLGYAGIAISWTLQPESAFKLWLRLAALFTLGSACFSFSTQLKLKQRILLSQILLSSVAFALAIALIEIASFGTITTFFKSYKPNYEFEFSELNRGAAYLALIAWPCIYYLLSIKKPYMGMMLLAVICFVLLFLESQSSTLALVFSIASFVFVYYFQKTGAKILLAGMLIGVLGIPLFVQHTTPQQIINLLPNLADSSQDHRLHIWKFAANKAEQKTWFGWGFDSSRHIPVGENEMLNNIIDHPVHPLPLHPHSSVIQLWLETGYVGVIVFAALLAIFFYHLLQQNLARSQLAAYSALYTSYFVIGLLAFGIWQQWWIAAGILAALFLKVIVSEAQSN